MTRPPLKPCGTQAAYQRHINNDEPPCQLCRNAQKVARIAYMEKRRNERGAHYATPPTAAQIRIVEQHNERRHNA